VLLWSTSLTRIPRVHACRSRGVGLQNSPEACREPGAGLGDATELIIMLGFSLALRDNFISLHKIHFWPVDVRNRFFVVVFSKGKCIFMQTNTPFAM